MAWFKKKKEEEDILPMMPEAEELPELPPLPGEEEFPETEPIMPKAPKMKEPMLPPMPEYHEPKPFLSMPSPPQIPQMPAPGPATVFVRIDKYKDVMETIGTMQEKLEELRATLNAISAIKSKESEIIDGWNAMLQQTKAKIDEVNAKLAKPQE